MGDRTLKRSTLLTIAAVAAVLALFFAMTAGTAREECSACVEFRGRSNCATASGPTRAQAQDGARTTACGPIASGMDETIACHNTTPKTLQCRTR